MVKPAPTAPRTAAELAVEIGAAAGAPPEAIARMAEVAELVAAAGDPAGQAKMDRRLATLVRLVTSWGALDGPEKALPIAVTLLGAAALVVRTAMNDPLLARARDELWKQITEMVGDSALGKEPSDE